MPSSGYTPRSPSPQRGSLPLDLCLRTSEVGPQVTISHDGFDHSVQSTPPPGVRCANFMVFVVVLMGTHCHRGQLPTRYALMVLNRRKHTPTCDNHRLRFHQSVRTQGGWVDADELWFTVLSDSRDFPRSPARHLWTTACGPIGCQV